MTKIGKIADVEVGVSVPLILDKDSLEPEARDVVRFGGEHTSVLNAHLAKQGQTTILASIPEIFLADMMKLSTTRKRQVKWKMSAREVVGENFAGVVTRSDGVFLEHKRTSRKFLFGNLGKCVIVKAKGREQEWEIIFYEIVHSDLATLTATISERRFAPQPNLTKNCGVSLSQSSKVFLKKAWSVPALFQMLVQFCLQPLT